MRIVIERNVYTRKETQASTQSYCCLGWYTRTATINNGSMKKRKKDIATIVLFHRQRIKRKANTITFAK